MSEDIKRGYAGDDGLAVREAKELGPYPPWDSWKHTLLRQLGEDVYEQFSEGEKRLLHDLYVFRRKLQQNIATPEDFESYNKRFQELGGESLYDNAKLDFAMRFIRRRTEPDQRY